MASFTEVRNMVKKNWKKYGRKPKRGYEYVRVNEIIGKDIEIEGVDEIDTKFGKGVAVYLSDGRYFITSAKILTEQAWLIKAYVEKDKDKVQAKIIRAKSRTGNEYLTFAD